MQEKRRGRNLKQLLAVLLSAAMICTGVNADVYAAAGELSEETMVGSTTVGSTIEESTIVEEAAPEENADTTEDVFEEAVPQIISEVSAASESEELITAAAAVSENVMVEESLSEDSVGTAAGIVIAGTGVEAGTYYKSKSDGSGIETTGSATDYNVYYEDSVLYLNSLAIDEYQLTAGEEALIQVQSSVSNLTLDCSGANDLSTADAAGLHNRGFYMDTTSLNGELLIRGAGSLNVTTGAGNTSEPFVVVNADTTIESGKITLQTDESATEIHGIGFTAEGNRAKLTIRGGNIAVKSNGMYGTKVETLEISGGTFVSQGAGASLSVIPILDGVTAKASVNYDGSGAVDYEPVHDVHYKWFRSIKAVTADSIKVAGTGIGAGGYYKNKADKSGIELGVADDYNVYYADGVLHLNNLDIENYELSGNETSLISLSADTVLDVTGTNKLTTKDRSGSANNYGISLDGTQAEPHVLTIRGTGTLESAPGTGKWSVAVHASYSDINITGAALNAKPGTTAPNASDGVSYGVFADGGNVNISGGIIHADAKAGTSSAGIVADHVNITGGEVYATSPAEGAVFSYGIQGYSSITMTGAEKVMACGASRAFGKRVSVNGMEAAASVNYDGSNPVTYVPEDNGTYKWFSAEKTVPDFIVSFNSCGGSSVSAQEVMQGQKLVMPTSVRDGYGILGWYTEPEYDTMWDFDVDTVTKSMTLYARWVSSYNPIHDDPEIVADAIDDVYYNAAAWKPDVNVYCKQDGKLVKMVLNKDYTVKYVNNKNASADSHGAWTQSDVNKRSYVQIIGKGNYAKSSSVRAYFKIRALDITGDSFTDTPVTGLTYNNGKSIKLPYTLQWGKKKLKQNSDYKVTLYYAEGSSYPEKVSANEVKEISKAGSYCAVAAGCGNFDGSRTMNFKVSDKISLAKVKAKLTNGKLPYTGNEIVLNRVVDGKTMSLVLTDKKEVLFDSADAAKQAGFRVSYQNNVNAGTAYLTIAATDDNEKYTGSKTLKFSILGTAINKTIIAEGWQKELTYNSLAQKQNFVMKDKATQATLSENDYSVSYLNNVQVGRATAVITGKGKYAGTMKKTFKIVPIIVSASGNDIAANVGTITATVSNAAVQNRAGALPELVMTYTYGAGARMLTLREDIDYTVKAKNNQHTGEAAATVTMKGNYKGSFVKNFTITAKSISADDIFIYAADQKYSAKKEKYEAKVQVFDKGTALKANKDYKIVSYRENTNVSANSVKTAYVTIEGTGDYSGSKETAFYIGKEMLNSARFNAKNWMTYTGQAITLSGNDIQATIGRGSNEKNLTIDTDYEIIASSYQKNVNIGKASVLVRGRGNYGGMKKITFRIVPKFLEEIR